jgi:ATP-dependent DNA helicase RecG
VKVRRRFLAALSWANPNIRTTELAEIIGISRSGIEKNIRQLKEENLIKRIGSDKSGHWEVIDKND